PISPYPHIRSAATQRRTEWRCRCGAVLHSERVYWPFLRGFDEKGRVQSSHLPVPCGAWPFQVLPPTDFVNSIRSDISHGHPYSLDAFINHKECDEMRGISALLRLPLQNQRRFFSQAKSRPCLAQPTQHRPKIDIGCAAHQQGIHTLKETVMTLNLGKAILDCVQTRPEEKFTARQIAEWIFSTYPAECQQKKSNSQSASINTDSDLIQQLVAEIGSRRPSLQKKHPELKVTEGRPRKYYYTTQTDIAAVAAAESTATKPTKQANGNVTTGEHALYPLLSRYLLDECGVYAKRIDEKRSSNKRGPNGNRWLYPDVVGMQDLGVEWHQQVRDCVSHYSDKRTKLWSFEVKLLINMSNVRECFFQTVSNSSWANFAYLVAAEIEGPYTLKELRMLFAAHGIGLIKLDSDTPADSQILIPARERDDIDWDMANRLATENRDFLEYIKCVKQFYQTGEAKSADWDIPETTD
ncbi:COG2958 family protein, partial [Xylella fastidiosa]